LQSHVMYQSIEKLTLKYHLQQMLGKSPTITPHPVSIFLMMTDLVLPIHPPSIAILPTA
jgi:hypothetical protein